MSDLERLARAIYAYVFDHADDFDDQRPEFQEEFRDYARGALKALEHPSEAMVEAGFAVVWGKVTAKVRAEREGFGPDGQTGRIFTAMIKSIEVG